MSRRTGEAIAFLAASETELAGKGIQLVAPVAVWDEPGPIKGIRMTLQSGQEIAIVLHIAHPELGIEVRSDSSDAPASTVANLLAYFRWPRSRVTRIAPPERTTL